MGPIETRLKQIISEACTEQQAEIEELEVMPDQVHLLVNVDFPSSSSLSSNINMSNKTF